MNMAFELKAARLADIPLQEASLNIWDTKYRLKTKSGEPVDRDIDGTYQRVAKALAAVEAPEKRGEWYEKFVWALQRGAIPAGRITSNAGAEFHKPATSTINCTVSGTIHDSMHDILDKVHEAGLTLKAGCVAPSTMVYTNRGLVTAERAVNERHECILSYDRRARLFEMRPILRHLTTHVPRNQNIEIVSGGTRLRTSVKHPVLVYRAGQPMYTRADDVRHDDALVQYRFPWTAGVRRSIEAWFAGAHLGDGSAYPMRKEYKPSRSAWAARARAAGQRLIFKIRAAEREVVERYAAFFRTYYASEAKVVAATTINGTPVWDYTVAKFSASEAADLFDRQIGSKSATLRVPRWIADRPDEYFLPFLAGLIDTDGTVAAESGHASIGMQSVAFASELKTLLAFFGIHGAVIQRKPRSRLYRGSMVVDSGGAVLKIADAAFLAVVAKYMADSGKRERILRGTTHPGQYDHYVLPEELSTALVEKSSSVGHLERQRLGFYHGYHRARVVSRIWLDRWAARFPDLERQIYFARMLRPVDAVRRDLDESETFYDFTVEEHNNYVAGSDGLVVIHNCGIGYEFSTLRPRGAYVSGAGAYTSGPLSFMDIYDKMCFTVSSAGGRRGAQMGTFDVGHPDVLDFIRAKRENGRLRQFNLSLLITDEFVRAVKEDGPWHLAFPLTPQEASEDGIDLANPEQVIWREWPTEGNYVANESGLVACKIYRTLPARRLWDMIMSSTYDFAEPGFVLIDRMNEMNNNWWCEDIRATNPCGEQGLPPYGACLLGSVNLTKFVVGPFTDHAFFDWDEFREVVKVFTRMLDNVVEVNGLPLERQREEILRKRRHGMGFLGLGSATALLGLRYGSPESVKFTEDVSRELAVAGWQEGLELAKEKGPAPILLEEFEVTAEMLHKRPEMAADGWKIGQRIPGRILHSRYSRYMQRVREVAPELVDELEQHGARFTHHSSIAPTGTISLSLANNASNGIEPSFAHHYFRNVVKQGKKSKEKIDVFSFELLAYRALVNPRALPGSTKPGEKLPDYFVSSEDITPREHVDIQAASQKWIDSSISKTANVPTDYPYEDFKDIYLYAHEKGLKGCTTFRFNPEAFQGVLVKEKDLKSTTYRFTLDDGTVIEAKGDDEILYDGETHSAANLFDALKEGYYGKL